MFVHELPRKTPDAIIPMEFDGQNHLHLAVPTVSTVFVCSVQENLVKQIYDSAYLRLFWERKLRSRFVWFLGHGLQREVDDQHSIERNEGQVELKTLLSRD